MLRFFRIYGMSIVSSLVVLYLSIIPKMPDVNFPDFALKDKILHGAAYLVLSMVVCYELYRQRCKFEEKVMTIWGILYPIFLGGMIEILQENFFPPRSGEWSDWLADIIGVILGFIVAKAIYPKFVKTESQGLSCK